MAIRPGMTSYGRIVPAYVPDTDKKGKKIGITKDGTPAYVPDSE